MRLRIVYVDLRHLTFKNTQALHTRVRIYEVANDPCLIAIHKKDLPYRVNMYRRIGIVLNKHEYVSVRLMEYYVDRVHHEDEVVLARIERCSDEREVHISFL